MVIRLASGQGGGEVPGKRGVPGRDRFLCVLKQGFGFLNSGFVKVWGGVGLRRATRGLEQGRRKPDGPMRVLLALIAKKPGIVRRVLG